MSFFAVTIEEISEIRPHSNADRLEVASLKGIGFQFVVGKNTWKVGERCLYFPLDSILPPPMLQALGVEGRLAGAQKNRIKTVKLRGEISQGLVGRLSLIDSLAESNRTPEKITEFLGVTKYEAEISLPMSQDGRLIELPEGVGVYDIENSERYPEALATLLEQPVWISEKLEGSHFAVAIIDGKEWVCQRRFALEILPDKPLHFFWEVAREEGIIELARNIASKNSARHVILRGEILGPNIQCNIYRLEKRLVRFFDVLINNHYVDVDALFENFEAFGRTDLLVPTIAKGITLAEWLAGRKLRDASNGQSMLHKTAREGIIIRPMKGASHPELEGRLILKQISPDYLAGAE